MTETDLLRALQLAASPLGMRLFRNQRGVYKLALPTCTNCQRNGRTIASGVGGNGGADLIGWHTYVIGTDDVGRTAATFLAVEGKVAPRKPTVDQMRFLDAVDRAGGLTAVAYDVDALAALAHR